MEEQGVTKFYRRISYRRKRNVVRFHQMSNQDKAFFGKDLVGDMPIRYLRFVDNEDRRGVSLVSMTYKKYPGKTPYLAHSAEAFAFLDKKTGAFRHKHIKTLMTCILKYPTLVIKLGLTGFFPVKIEDIEATGLAVQGVHLPTWDRLVRDGLLDLNLKPLDPVAKAMSDANEMLDFVTLTLSHVRICKGIIKGDITTLKQAVKIRWKFPSGKLNTKQALAVFTAFGRNGLTYYPYIATSAVGIYNCAINSRRTSGKPFYPGERLYEEGVNPDYDLMADLIDMSDKMLLKVNFDWSARRIKEEHDRLVKASMSLKGTLIPERRVEYKIPPPEIPGLTVLNSNHQLMLESLTMHHCVGTSSHYFDEIRNGQGLIVHFEYEGEPHTIHFKISNNNQLRISQITKKFNGRPSEPAMEAAKRIMAQLEVSQFMENFPFNEEYKDKAEPAHILDDFYEEVMEPW